MIFLRQSTAATIKLGPYVSSDDGVTLLNALSIGPSAVALSKNGGAFGIKHDESSVTTGELGCYAISLDASDTDTLQRLKIVSIVAGALPVWAEYMVITQEAYDALISVNAGYAKAQVLDVVNTAITAQGGIVDDLEALLTQGINTYNRIGAPDTTSIAEDISSIANNVWNATTRRLSATGITDIVSGVWAAGSRTLTGFGNLIADVWTNTVRTLTSSQTSDSGIVATLNDYEVIYGTEPYAGAYVRVYSDSAYTNLVKQGKTGSDGLVSFGFDAVQAAMFTDDKPYILVDIPGEATKADTNEVITWLE